MDTDPDLLDPGPGNVRGHDSFAQVIQRSYRVHIARLVVNSERERRQSIETIERYGDDAPDYEIGDRNNVSPHPSSARSSIPTVGFVAGTGAPTNFEDLLPRVPKNEGVTTERETEDNRLANLHISLNPSLEANFVHDSDTNLETEPSSPSRVLTPAILDFPANVIMDSETKLEGVDQPEASPQTVLETKEIVEKQMEEAVPESAPPYASELPAVEPQNNETAKSETNSDDVVQPNVEFENGLDERGRLKPSIPIFEIGEIIEGDSALDEVSRLQGLRRAADSADSASLAAWAEALEAEKELSNCVDEDSSHQQIEELENRVAFLRQQAVKLGEKAEAARRDVSAAEDEADRLQRKKLEAEAEKISHFVKQREEAEAAAKQKEELELSRKREKLKEEAARAAENALHKKAAQKESLLKKIALRRRETEAKAQKKVSGERIELAKRTLKLDLSSLGIDAIPSYVYSDPLLRHIRILWLNQNEFEAIPAEISILQELTQLRAFQNKIRVLPPELGDLAKLQILWLQDNLLDTLPPEIEKLTSLTLLSLKGNPLKALPVELSRLNNIRNMELETEHLNFPPPAISRAGTQQIQEFLGRADRAWASKTLDLSNMGLDSLPLEIIDLFPYIERLWINGNPIEAIPFEFHAMTQITELCFDSDTMKSPSSKIWDFGHERAFEFMRLFQKFREDAVVDLREWNLDEIPGEVFESGLASRLKSMFLSKNRILEIKESISKLESLENLSLDNNAVGFVHEGICLLSSLTRLSMSSNKLISFPDRMATMHSLGELMLDSNSLTSLPQSILHLTCLRILSISSNCVIQLPSELPRLTSLRKLLVENNAIQRLPFEFGLFSNLVQLEVSGNPLWSPPKDIISQGISVWFSYLMSIASPLRIKAIASVKKDIRSGVLQARRFNLTQFPPEICRYTLQFMCLTEIDMDVNKLSELPKEVGKLTNLTSLSFANNLFMLCPPVFGKLHNLTSINLERNLLTFIPMDIGNLSALKILRVDGNKISHPPMEVVKMGIPALLRFLKLFAQGSVSGELLMSGNNLKAMPIAIAGLENITRLDLSHNAIGRLPCELFDKVTLETLDISYNVITHLEPEISRLSNLRLLNLSANRIDVLSSSLLSLTKLQSLFMNLNLVDDVPPSISRLQKLKELKISSNNIETLPMELGRLVALEKLNCSNNLISAIPTTFGSMTSLRLLSVASNDLSSLPPILGVMTGLRNLHFLHNDLEKHPPEIVTEAQTMNAKSGLWHDGKAPASILCLWLARIRSSRITRELDASNFGLFAVPAEVLGLSTLQLLQLNLGNNKISSLPPAIFAFTSLTHLDVSHNMLENLSRQIGALTNLTILYLNSNKLSKIPLEVGHLPATNLKRLAINNNMLDSPPNELMMLPTSDVLHYLLSSEIAIHTAALDWSWCRSFIEMRSICLEVTNWRKLVRITLDNNKISKIDVELCLAMDELEVLELRRNRLTKIPDQLSSHSRLKTLALSGNRIAKLPLALSLMPSLACLEVDDMQIEFPCTEITCFGSENILSYLHAIFQAHRDRVCVISYFALSQIPAEVYGVKYIAVLEMDGMKISELPEQLAKLVSLQRLSFNFNFVSELPAFMASLANLKELEFEGNQISRLLPVHYSLTNLVHLNPKENPIWSPPEEVFLSMPITVAVAKIVEDSTVGLNGGSEPESRPNTSNNDAGQDHLNAVYVWDPLAPCALHKVLKSDPSVVLRFLRSLFIAHTGTALFFTDFKLKLWPKELLEVKHVTEVCLDRNEIRFIGKEIEELCDLRKLSVADNKLKSLVPNIGSLTSLEYIDVSKNELEEISSAIGNLHKLEELKVTDNRISVLPPEIFNCTSLRLLHLDGNKLIELPPEFAQLINLQDLRYKGNPLIIPPEDIRSQGLVGLLRFYKEIMAAAPACEFKGMECQAAGYELKLLNFNLAHLPEVVYRGMPRPGGSWDDPPNRSRRDRWAFGMTHLTSLVLEHNILCELPEMIWRCCALQSISAKDNALIRLPQSFTALTCLRLLDLRNNKLETLHPGLSRLQALQELLVDDNNLVHIPDGLCHLHELHTISANRNALRDLPVDFCHSTSLQTLCVNENPFRMPPWEIVARGLRHIMDWLGRINRCKESLTLDLRGLDLSSVDYTILPVENVKRILLSNNKLTSISSEESTLDEEGSTVSLEVAGLLQLEYLHVDNNRLTQIPASMCLLTSLTELSLCNNQIFKIPISMCTNLTNLRKLRLSNNSLTTLPVELAVLSTVLMKLDVDGNPLTMPPRPIIERGLPSLLGYLDNLFEARESLEFEVTGAELESIPNEVLDLSNLQSLVLDDNLIGAIPTHLGNVLSNLTCLSLSRNRISAVPREICWVLTGLVVLRLDGNQLSSLPTQIGDLTCLEELTLHNNSIIVLPLDIGLLSRLQVLTLDLEEMVSPSAEICNRGARAVVSYLDAVQEGKYSGRVDLRSMRLSSFPVEVFAIQNLTALHLDDNSITVLPPSVERLTDLTELTLTRMRLTSLPYMLGACSRLSKLRLDVSRRFRNPPFELLMQGTAVVVSYLRRMYLCAKKTGYAHVSRMGLQQLPSELLALPNLSHLQCRDNELLRLPETITSLHSIEALHFHGNQLSTLPPEIGRLGLLLVLRLGSNRIFHLPVQLGACYGLRKLSVQNNELATIAPEILSGLSCLESLNVSCNQLVSLNDAVGDMAALCKLRLDQNQLRAVPASLGACTRLTLLSLTSNLLTGLPDELGRCTGMTALHLSVNKFRLLPRCIDSFGELRWLWASNNAIAALPTSLARLPNLYELQVSGCPELRYPPREVVAQGLDALRSYLTCNAQYEDFLERGNLEGERAAVAAAKARGDGEAAELAAALIKPLRRRAEEAAEAAARADGEAAAARDEAERLAAEYDELVALDWRVDGRRLSPRSRAATEERFAAQRERAEEAVLEAEEAAERARERAAAAAARVEEGVRLFGALSALAAESEAVAEAEARELELSGGGEGHPLSEGRNVSTPE